MKQDLPIKNGITIPEHELHITASRAGGPGGQHVNKTSTKAIVRWNVRQSVALTHEQKERIIAKLGSELTSEGDLITQSSATRGLQQNKHLALSHLAKKVSQALHVPKKRIATAIPKATKEAFLQQKKQRSQIKKMRSKKISYD
jgi:ribosome-associated protein